MAAKYLLKKKYIYICVCVCVCVCVSVCDIQYCAKIFRFEM